MLERYCIIVALVFYTLFSSVLTYAYEVVDDSDQHIELNQPPERIVSLSPHITELLFSIGAGDQIVATSDYSDYPDAAKKLPRVGGYQGINVEALMALNPDMVIGWPDANPHNIFQKLRLLGIPVLISNPKNHLDIIRNVRWLGTLTGNSHFAEKEAKKAEDILEWLRKNYGKKAPVNVFYQLGDEPLMSQSANTYIGQAIELCSGINIFADQPAPAPVVSREAVLEINPDVIIGSSSEDSAPAWLSRWKAWSFMKAVRNKHLYSVNADLTHRPTLRFFEGTQQLCERIDRARMSIGN